MRVVRAVGTADVAPSSERGARLPTAEDLEAARTLRQQPWARALAPTEVRRVAALDAGARGARVWLAVESKQVTGSFKVRGALFALERLAARGVREVVVVSAGNHGAGVSFAARELGVRATVCVPETAPEAKRSKIRGYGADIVVVPTPSYDEAERHAMDLATRRGLPFLSPYDDHDVVLGNGASLAFDVAAALGHAPAIAIAPFGGGGLATGLAWGFGRGTAVWGAQTESSPAMAESLLRGEAILAYDSAPTLAEGLEGGIARDAFDRARAVIAGVVVVDEAAIARAMRYARSELGLDLEGSAATALAPVLGGLPAELAAPADADLVVVLTGSNVDPERLDAIAPRAAAESC